VVVEGEMIIKLMTENRGGIDPEPPFDNEQPPPYDVCLAID
jgi:hypothetical protein